MTQGGLRSIALFAISAVALVSSFLCADHRVHLPMPPTFAGYDEVDCGRVFTVILNGGVQLGGEQAPGAYEYVLAHCDDSAWAPFWLGVALLVIAVVTFGFAVRERRAAASTASARPVSRILSIWVAAVLSAVGLVWGILALLGPVMAPDPFSESSTCGSLGGLILRGGETRNNGGDITTKEFDDRLDACRDAFVGAVPTLGWPLALVALPPIVTAVALRRDRLAPRA